MNQRNSEPAYQQTIDNEVSPCRYLVTMTILKCVYAFNSLGSIEVLTN